jgi:hypothetical protein
MRKTIKMALAGVAIAGSALSVGVSSANASASAHDFTSENWSGYFMDRPGPQTFNGHKYQPRLEGVGVSFTIPHVQKNYVVGKPVYEASMWIGLGGMRNVRGTNQPQTLEQCGVVEVADSTTGARSWMLFWEMYPFNHEADFNGKPVYVKPGDKIYTMVTPPWNAGGSWRFLVQVNDHQYTQTVPANKWHANEPTTAEAITEWAGGIAGVGPVGIKGKTIHGVPNTGTVGYSNAGVLVTAPGKPAVVRLTQNRIMLAHDRNVWVNGHGFVKKQYILIYPTAAQPSDKYDIHRSAFHTVFTGNW